MVLNPLGKIGMQTKALHLLSRKPSGRLCFSYAECTKLMVNVGAHHVEFPTAAAFLHFDAGNPNRWEWSNFLFSLPASCHFRRFSGLYGAARYSPCAAMIHGIGSLLEKVDRLCIRRDESK